MVYITYVFSADVADSYPIVRAFRRHLTKAFRNNLVELPDCWGYSTRDGAEGHRNGTIVEERKRPDGANITDSDWKYNPGTEDDE